MQLRNLALIAAMSLSLSAGCSESADGGAGGSGGDGGAGGSVTAYAGNVCVGAKQVALGVFCSSVFDAWGGWESDQDDTARNSSIAAARTALEASWDAAESTATEDGADCSDLALTPDEASLAVDSSVQTTAESINDGLDLGQADQAACGAELLSASGQTCESVLALEGAHIADLEADPEGSQLDAETRAVFEAFGAAWSDATGGACPTNASESEVRDAVQRLIDEGVLATIVTPGLDSDQYTTLTPGPTEYQGRTYTPQCMQGSGYRYFAKRGSVNKLMIYYQGGGACWDNLTCSFPACRTEPDPDMGEYVDGFFDLESDENPFRDWNIVFVSYCTCDVHFGDATVEYDEATPPITVQHLGYHNSKVAEKWAREHFLNPEVVFVTGSSAGAYGAWFNGPLLHEVWPASQIHVLADAGNGVITEDFLQNQFGNWNFVANLPDVPGALESITEGNGMPGYTEAVASAFGDTNWAHVSTLYDGSLGGQTGFYNIMLTGGDLLTAFDWWNASCTFGETALAQAEQTFEVVPSNYRYYFGAGTMHTVWRADKVYDDTTGGVPTIVDWVRAMLASGPDGPDANWSNVLCSNCGLLLDGDPMPEPLAPPFEQQGEDVVVVCE